MTNQLEIARHGQPHIAITPNPVLVDQPVHIRLTGFAPDQRVTLQAQMEDDANQTWQAEATFKTLFQMGMGRSSTRRTVK